MNTTSRIGFLAITLHAFAGAVEKGRLTFGFEGERLFSSRSPALGEADVAQHEAYPINMLRVLATTGRRWVTSSVTTP